MPLILAIEPDKRQAAQLKVLVRNRIRADLILADTTELALEAIGDRIPDLVLVPALLSPEEDGALNAALRVIAAAAHVQTLTIPVFASSHTKKAPVKTGGLLAKLLAGKAEAAPEGCDPAVFGDQIAAYLADAAANRQASGYDDDDFADEPPAPSPAESFARVDTFAPADSFQAAIDSFEAADVFASDDQTRDLPAEKAPYEEPPTAVVREPEQPAPAQTAAPSIFRDVDEPVVPPVDERPSLFDSLFKRTDRKPAVAEPAEPDWPVYEPPPAPVEQAAKTVSDPDTDWAPPADQSIALDQPNPVEEPAAFAAAAPAVAERADPAEEAVWAEHEAEAEAALPEPPPTKWTPLPTVEPPGWRPTGGLAAGPPPADLLAEFTADLTAVRAARPRAAEAPPTPRPVPPPKPQPVAAQAAPQPTPPAKPQPAAQPSPRQTPPAKPQPMAAHAEARPTPPPKPPAAKPTAAATLKAQTERPAWTALSDALRQD